MLWSTTHRSHCLRLRATARRLPLLPVPPPLAHPFSRYRSILSGRLRGWDHEESNDDHPASYLDTARRPAKPIVVSSLRVAGAKCKWVDKVLGEGGGTQSTTTIADVDRSPPPMPMGGGRSSPTGGTTCDHLGRASPQHKATSVSLEGACGASRRMLQLISYWHRVATCQLPRHCL